MDLISHVVVTRGDSEQQTAGRISRISIAGEPTIRVDDEGSTRSRRDGPDGNPMSIGGKGYLGNQSRAPTHFAAKAGRWASVGAELMTLTALISYNYGNESHRTNILYPREMKRQMDGNGNHYTEQNGMRRLPE